MSSISSPLKPIRVCVLNCSYEGVEESDLKEYEEVLEVNPRHFYKPPTPKSSATEGSDDEDSSTHQPYTFTLAKLHKKSSYLELRKLVTSGQFDVFFNLCDGLKEEEKSGKDVVETLEGFQVPFTGAISRYYEYDKAQMKMVAHYCKIRSPMHAVLAAGSDLVEESAHMGFPRIIKQLSGYSSVGLRRDCKCYNEEDFVKRVTQFIKEHGTALVEEFIAGDEATVLACADPSEPDGIRVYPPVMVSFPPNEDFKHFELKWKSFEGMVWTQMDAEDPARAEVERIGRLAFKNMMGGIGYGRTDVRINRETGRVYFLELNTNCGIMYPPGQEASADWILELSQSRWKFAELQIRNALDRHQKLHPRFRVHYSITGGYHLRATSQINKGDLAFPYEGHLFRIFSSTFVETHWDSTELAWFYSHATPLSRDKSLYALWDVDPVNWRPINHNCNPNLEVARPSLLNMIALCDIKPGEELTIDYEGIFDSNLKPFDCHCGAKTCRGRIVPSQRLTLDEDFMHRLSPNSCLLAAIPSLSKTRDQIPSPMNNIDGDSDNRPQYYFPGSPSCV